jgi:hypothetical protein
MTYEELLKLTKAGVEIWKPVVGYEGYYEVSNLGRIKSVERYVKQGNSMRHVRETIKAVHINSRGYPFVTLCKDRKSNSIAIHIILAKAFIPNPEGKPAVDHINTNRADNRLENLRWVTYKENSNNELTLKHCRENTYSKETMKKRLDTNKERNTCIAPKTIYQYTKGGELIKEFYSMADAERETGINHNSIHRALNDNTQSAGGYLWSTTLTDNFIFQRRFPTTSKQVLQYDKDENFIHEWPSIKEAERGTGIYRANILRSIKSSVTPRKYIFKFKEGV